MTDFGTLMREKAQSAREKPAPDVDMVSYILDTYPDLADLAARMEADLRAYARQSKGPGDSRAHAALEACREFQEKYSHD